MRAFLVIILSVFTITAYSQTKEEKKKARQERIEKLMEEEEEGTIIFSRQTAFGIKLNTDGYGIFLELGKAKTTRLTNSWWLELGEHKSNQEKRVMNIAFAYSSNPFIYGKINNFYEAKLGYNQQRVIGTMGTQNGVSVSAIYGGGISAALMKPYMLTVYDSVNRYRDIKFADDPARFLNENNIVGSAGFTKGWSDVKFIPGVHARAAMRFDYGRFNDVLSAIELGVNAMYYTKDVEIMALNPGKKFFLNGYVAILFGKRKR
jgi:hypothetical protein